MTDKTEAQPEALRLAQFFESLTESSHRWWDGVPVHEKAATVLRSLVTEIEQIKAERATQTNRAAAAEQQVTALSQRLDTVNALNTEARNQLAQLSARQAAPDGWRLVPVEPTEEMIKAGNTKTWVLPCNDCWSEMLSAAPPPPEREPLTDEQIAQAAVNAGMKPIYDKPKKLMVNALGSSVPFTWLKAFAHGIGATNE